MYPIGFKFWWFSSPFFQFGSVTNSIYPDTKGLNIWCYTYSDDEEDFFLMEGFNSIV